MKIVGLSILILLLASSVSAQQYRFSYYLDNNFASVSKENATMVGKGYYEGKGSFKLDCFYKESNELFMTVHFSDSTLGNLQGVFQSFYLDGKKENDGFYNNSLEEGTWKKWDYLGQLVDSMWYKNGKIVSTSTYYYYNGELQKTDLHKPNDTEHTYGLYRNGQLYLEATFGQGSGIIITYENGKAVSDTLNCVTAEDASFKGGDQGWANYVISKLLKVDDAIYPVGTTTVIVNFIVRQDGTVDNIYPENHPGKKMEDEAVRIIKESPRWNAATCGGKKVVAFRRQPITFMKDQ